MDPILLIIGLFILAIFFRLIAGSLDRGRVQRYLNKRGCRLIEQRWRPFGPGWFGEGNARIYEIEYRDHEGRVYHANVKTSMLSGVYLTNDRLIQDKPKPTIEAEKAKLRQRLAALEKKSPN